MVRDLGKRLKLERVRCGFLQKDVAKRITIDTSSISTYERGTTTPPAEVLMKLASLYNVSVDYLLGLEKRNSVYTEGLNERQINVLRIIAEQFIEDNSYGK